MLVCVSGRRRRLFTWQRPKAGGDVNDFFQFSTHEGLGVGGVGSFAIWVRAGPDATSHLRQDLFARAGCLTPA